MNVREKASSLISLMKRDKTRDTREREMNRAGSREKRQNSSKVALSQENRVPCFKEEVTTFTVYSVSREESPI